MISRKVLNNLAAKWQTGFANAAREYVQNLFLNYLYKQTGTDRLLFKGGTALRLLHNSPRFSEDLDFDGYYIYCREVEDVCQEVVLKLVQDGVKVDIEDATETWGGCLAIFAIEVYGSSFPLKIEVSLRKRWEKPEKKVDTVRSEFISGYPIFRVNDAELVRGKLNAVLSRTKSRDLFDLYYILRSRLEIEQVIENKTDLIKIAEEYDYSTVPGAITELLPVSFRPLVKDFKKTLLGELRRL